MHERILAHHNGFHLIRRGMHPPGYQQFAKLFPDGRVKYDESGRRVGAELCIVQWQKGRPVAVHPESIAVAKAIWPKLS